MGIVATILVGLAAIACLVRPAWGFCGYIATIIIRPNEQWDGVLIPAIPVMIVCAAVGYLLHSSRTLPRLTGPKPKSPTWMMVMMGLLFLHLVLWHRDQLVDWILSDLAQVFLMLLYLTHHFSTPERLATHFNTVTGSALVVTGIPFFIHFFMKEKRRLVKNQIGDQVESYGALWDLYHLTGSGRLMGKATGTWGNSNELGMLVNWAIPGVLYQLRKQGSKLLKLPALALLGMLLATLFLTGSRGGQLQLGITLWMVFVGGKRKGLGIVLLLLALLGILVVLPRLSPERKDAGASSEERTMVLQAGVEMFKSNPILGIGFNSFQERSPRKLHAHNVYMQCLAETGLLGATIFFPLILFLRRETSKAVRHFESATNSNHALLARCIGALQFSYSVFILFSNQFMRFTFAVPMTMAVGLYAAALRRQSAIKQETSPTAEVSSGSERKATASELPDRETTSAEATAAPASTGRSAMREATRTPAALLSREEHRAEAPAVSSRRSLAEAASPNQPGAEGTKPAAPSGPAAETHYVFDPERPEKGVQAHVELRYDTEETERDGGRKGPSR